MTVCACVFVNVFVEIGSETSSCPDANIQMVLKVLPKEPITQKCLGTTVSIQYILTI